MMLKRMSRIAVLLVVVSVFALPNMAFAANRATYSIWVPAIGNAWSSNHFLGNGRLFETALVSSAGADIAMAVCRADTRAALGPTVRVSPTGRLTALWRNNTGVSRWVVVRLNSVAGVTVGVWARGAWLWNHL